MAEITPYFLFNGNCREAMIFYSKVFKTEPVIETYAEAAAHSDSSVLDDIKDKVKHGELRFSGEVIMFADVPSSFKYNFGNNIVTAFRSSNIDEIKEVFSILKENGTVTMELQETPWSKCYGSVTDQFGLSWNLNHDTTL